MLRRAGEILQAEARAFAAVMTAEMGKLLGAAVQEAEKCAACCRYYADHAEEFLRPEVIAESAGARDAVMFQPLGAVLAVMPWNFPFWQVIRFAAPALAAGNVGLLKHASNVPQCALALEDLFARAGAPAGVFQTLLIGSDRVAAIIADDRVAAVTVTGSEGAGRDIAATAGKHVKKSVLELGGSDAFIVLPSADLPRAVATAVKARIVNNGQSCIAAKRFIVADAIYDRFVREFASAMAALRIGDPAAPDTELGPLALASIRDDVADQVERSVAAGARLLAGGQRLEGPGFFYPPTVLADVPPDAPAAREEVFGPVAAVFRVAGIDEAIALANATPVRPGRGGVDARPRRGGPAGARAGIGQRVHQRHGRVRPAVPVRRRQALGLRTRAGRVRPARVRQHQDGADGGSRVIGGRRSAPAAGSAAAA